MRLPDLPEGVDWGVSVRDAASGAVLAEHRPDAVQPTASLAKLLLLVEVARAAAAGERDLRAPVRRDAVAPVADSGLWQHLAHVPELSLHDAAVLVGTVSDNWATNALLDLVGLDAVDRVRGDLALHLHDLVRDARGPQHPPTLSTGSAAALSALFARLHAGAVVSPGVSAQVLGWLAPAVDLSMVAGAFGLDPLAHADPDRGVRVWSKTGTSPGVRGDAGLVVRGDRAVAYAVLARWDEALDRRDEVLAAMREVGRRLLSQDLLSQDLLS